MNKKQGNPFKSEVSIFALSTGLKVSGIFLVVLALLFYILWVVLFLNNVFFESRGFVAGVAFREAYFDMVLQSAFELWPWLLLLVIALFFIGVMMASLLLRPFRGICSFCEKRLEGKNAVYEPPQFSNFRLLTGFSDFFFQYLEDSFERREMPPASIPSRYLGIRKPVFDSVFFFHFLFLISILTLVSVSILNMATAYMREGIVDLAVTALKNHGVGTSHFFQEQAVIFDSLNWLASALLVVSYLLLSFHLYGKVSGAAFGFFSTMRSFMKGNTSARVRLLGYNHVRPYGLVFNQYLKYVELKLGKNKNLGNNK